MLLEARRKASLTRRFRVAGKGGSLAILIFAEIAVLSLWFSSTAVLPEMAVESGVSASDLAWLSTAVPLGFVIGALIYAALGLADRYDPRHVFMLSALAGAMANLALLTVPIGGWEAIVLRGLTGAAMAGVYPVGMKIAAGWGRADRAFLVSLLISGLTIGSASSHLMALSGGADWRLTIWASTLAAIMGGVAVLAVNLGPWHAKAPTLDIAAISLIWTNRRVRLAVLGYIGHMWELYAFWAWVGVVATASYSLDGSEAARFLGKLTAFLAIGLGGLACVPAGWLAVRFGSARVAHLFDVEDLLAQVRVPTLVMHIRSDAVQPFEEGRKLAAKIPGARFVPLEGRNHLPLSHDPAWERFLSELNAFLQTPAAETRGG
jgi:MFS family permease